MLIGGRLVLSASLAAGYQQLLENNLRKTYLTGSCNAVDGSQVYGSSIASGLILKCLRDCVQSYGTFCKSKLIFPAKVNAETHLARFCVCIFAGHDVLPSQTPAPLIWLLLCVESARISQTAICCFLQVWKLLPSCKGFPEIDHSRISMQESRWRT